MYSYIILKYANISFFSSRSKKIEVTSIEVKEKDVF